MINKETAIIRALITISDVFGIDYVKLHKNAPYCYNYNEDETLKVTFLFQDKNDRPDLKPNHLGWTVYATVNVNMNTGESKMEKYILPDGTYIEEV